MIMFYPTEESVKYARGVNSNGETTALFTHNIDPARGITICASDQPVTKRDMLGLTLLFSTEHSVADQVKKILKHAAPSVVAGVATANFLNADNAALFLANYPEIIAGDISSSWNLIAVVVGRSNVTLRYSDGTEEMLVRLNLPSYEYYSDELVFEVPAHDDYTATGVCIRKVAKGYTIAVQAIRDKDIPWSAAMMVSTDTIESAMKVECAYPVQETERVLCNYRLCNFDKSFHDLNDDIFYCY